MCVCYYLPLFILQNGLLVPVRRSGPTLYNPRGSNAQTDDTLEHLFHMGFLTIRQNFAAVEQEVNQKHILELVIPNNQTKHTLLNALERHYQLKYGISITKLIKLSEEFEILAKNRDECELDGLKNAFESLIEPINLAQFTDASTGFKI